MITYSDPFNNRLYVLFFWITIQATIVEIVIISSIKVEISRLRIYTPN